MHICYWEVSLRRKTIWKVQLGTQAMWGPWLSLEQGAILSQSWSRSKWNWSLFLQLPLGLSPLRLWARLTLGYFLLLSLPGTGPTVWTSSGKGIMSLSLHCWLQVTFLGPGRGSRVVQSSELSGVCFGPLGWEGQNTHGELCWFLLSRRTWGKGGGAPSLLSLIGRLFYVPLPPFVPPLLPFLLSLTTALWLSF